jgi:hypothetical protein
MSAAATKSKVVLLLPATNTWKRRRTCNRMAHPGVMASVFVVHPEGQRAMNWHIGGVFLVAVLLAAALAVIGPRPTGQIEGGAAGTTARR